MTKADFAKLFTSALEKACNNAETRIGGTLPRRFTIKFYGAGRSGDLLQFDEAIDLLYLSPDLFFQIIDLTVIEVTDKYTKVFVRASSHSPTTFDRTWNSPPGMGPFKQIYSDEIQDLRSQKAS